VLLFSEWNNFVFIFILFKIKEFIVQGYPTQYTTFDTWPTPANLKMNHLFLLLVLVGMCSGASFYKKVMTRSPTKRGLTVEKPAERKAFTSRRLSRIQFDGDLGDLNSFELDLFNCLALSDSSSISNALDSLVHQDLPPKFVFRFIPLAYQASQEYSHYEAFLEKFDFNGLTFRGKYSSSLDFEAYSSKAFKEVLLAACDEEKYFMAFLQTQRDYILAHFKFFWATLLEQGKKLKFRSKCHSVDQAVYWAFDFFGHCEDMQIRSSECIFEVLLGPISPTMRSENLPVFPENFIHQLLLIPGIDLNVSLQKGHSLAIGILRLPNLPPYYHRLILSHPNLDVNQVSPAGILKYNSRVRFQVALPLFWHCIIYQSYRAMAVLWHCGRLQLSPLFGSFTNMLQFFLLFIIYSILDRKNYHIRR
jgi:hypothetical protein